MYCLNYVQLTLLGAKKLAVKTLKIRKGVNPLQKIFMLTYLKPNRIYKFSVTEIIFD